MVASPSHDKKSQKETYLASTSSLHFSIQNYEKQMCCWSPQSGVFHYDSQSRLRHMEMDSLDHLMLWGSILSWARAARCSTRQALSGHWHDSRGEVTHRCGQDAWVLWGWLVGLRHPVSSVSDTSLTDSKVPPLSSIGSCECWTFWNQGVLLFIICASAKTGTAKPMGAAVEQRLVCYPAQQALHCSEDTEALVLGREAKFRSTASPSLPIHTQNCSWMGVTSFWSFCFILSSLWISVWFRAIFFGKCSRFNFKNPK